MKKSLILTLYICSGIVIGFFVAALTKSVDFLKWLSFGFTFGTTSPLVLDLKVVQLTLGANLQLNISVIIFIAIAAILYYYFNHRGGKRRK